MATPAAILQVLLEVESTKATAALRRFDSSVARTGTSSKVATGRTTALNKATTGLGSSLGRAARYAAGAAVAYMSIAQAKAAVTVTQDLAKTSAGLNRNLGLTTKTASRWGTVAKARDVDTRSLNLSFTTLSRRLTDVSKGSSEAIDSFKDVGITQKDIQRTGGDFNQQLLLVADAFGEAEGGALRQQAAQKLLGRGYQNILPMFAEGAKGLEEQFMWADRYGTALDKKAVAAQMRLVNAQRESKVAMLGLQVSFTKFVTPALREANKEFQHLSAIMANDKLTQAEKWKKVGDIVSKWGDKALDAFVEILPKMVEKAGEAAPRIAGAFVKGFINAPVMGQLVLGAWLMRGMGGTAAAATLGTTMGRSFGKKFGIAAAAIAGYQFAKDFQDEISGVAADIFGGSNEENSNLLESITGIDVGGPLRDALNLEDEKTPLANWEKSLDIKGLEKWSKHARDTNEKLNRDVPIIYRRGGEAAHEETKRTREKIDKTTLGQAHDVGANADNMVNRVGDGLNRLRDNTNRALKAYGVKVLNYKIDLNKSSSGGAFHGFRRGGPINTGASSGDSVPAMLERGEYVLNRNAVGAVGKGNLDRLNFGAAKRFAKGGEAGGMGAMISRVNQFEAKSFPYVWGGGHGGFGLQPVDCSGFVSDVLNQGGLLSGAPMVSGALTNWGKPGKGPLTVYANSGHTLMSLNGRFAGTSASNPGGGAGWLGEQSPGYLSGFTARTMDVVGGMISEIKRLVLKGPDGPLKSMGQGALNMAHKAASAFLSKQMPSGSFGGGDAQVGVSGSLQAIAQRMIESQWGAGQWPYFNDLVMRESGWNPRAVNPSSGAAGLAQALPPSKYPPGAWPYTGKDSAVAQLQWMVDYISGRYGNPAGAIAFHNANNWYQKGGEVMPSLDRGGRVTQSGLAQVHPGDVHMGKSSPNINVYVDPVSLDVRVETIVEGMAPDIAEFTARQLGRGQGRSRQLSRG